MQKSARIATIIIQNIMYAFIIYYIEHLPTSHMN